MNRWFPNKIWHSYPCDGRIVSKDGTFDLYDTTNKYRLGVNWSRFFLDWLNFCDFLFVFLQTSFKTSFTSRCLLWYGLHLYIPCPLFVRSLLPHMFKSGLFPIPLLSSLIWAMIGTEKEKNKPPTRTLKTPPLLERDKWKLNNNVLNRIETVRCSGWPQRDK